MESTQKEEISWVVHENDYFLPIFPVQMFVWWAAGNGYTNKSLDCLHASTEKPTTMFYNDEKSLQSVAEEKSLKTHAKDHEPSYCHLATYQEFLSCLSNYANNISIA